eukprot:1299446-Prymnesium_polylepis.1
MAGNCKEIARGCWDGYGQLSDGYATQDAPHMRAAWAMIAHVAMLDGCGHAAHAHGSGSHGGQSQGQGQGSGLRCGALPPPAPWGALGGAALAVIIAGVLALLGCCVCCVRGACCCGCGRACGVAAAATRGVLRGVAERVRTVPRDPDGSAYHRLEDEGADGGGTSSPCVKGGGGGTWGCAEVLARLKKFR